MQSGENHLTDLNDEQKQAVTHSEGPLLIVAGAGTGKTTVVTRRIAWLIESGKCKPEEILALTFTEKAAGEMEERVDRILPYGYVNLWISTFHSFCQRILERHGLDIGIPNEFKLLDTTAGWLLIRKNLDRFNLDYYRPLGNPTKFIHALLQHFSRAKDEGILPEDYLRYAQGLRLSAELGSGSVSQGESVPDPNSIKRAEEIANAYHVYQQLLLENSALDFGDLLVYTRELFIKRPAILEQYRKQFAYILVDEFQDTNWIQYEIVKLLAAPKNNITVVGDDDQAVFMFRGASYHNIIQFKKDYPQSREVFLTQNYRSRQNILDCAYQFIQLNNPDRLEWQLNNNNFLESQNSLPRISSSGPDIFLLKNSLDSGRRLPYAPVEKHPEGNFANENTPLSKRLRANHALPGTIEHIHCATLDAEQEAVIKKILTLKESDPTLQWSDFSILVRANDMAQSFGRYAGSVGIPYYVVALKGLYTKPIILDLLALCTVALRPHDSPALWRVLNMPVCSFEPSTLIALSHYAHKQGLSLFEACQKCDCITDCNKEDRAVIKDVVARIEKHTVLARTKPASEVFLTLVRDHGILDYLKDADTDEKRASLKYLDALYKKVRDCASGIPDARLADILEIIDMEQEAGEQGSVPKADDISPDAVHIQTCHSAKGLEFRYVFIVNLVDRRFPTVERADAIELPAVLLKEISPQGDAHLEEERRLFYVALTRAKEGIYFTSSHDVGGARKKKLSRFLHEAGVVREERADVIPNEERNPVASQNTRISHDILDESLTKPPLQNTPYKLPAIYSYSQLAAFDKCPLQYKFGFILKIPVFGKPSLSFGRTLHLTLQRFFQLIHDIASKNQPALFNMEQSAYTASTGRVPSLDDLFNIYSEVWVDEWYANKRQKEEYRERGRDILKRVYAEVCVVPPHPHALERDFTIKVGTPPNMYAIKGRIDRVDARDDGTVEIIDYKTGAGKESLTSDEKDQLMYYQVACQEVFGEQPSKLTYHYLEDGNKISFLGSDRDIEKLKEKAVSMIDKIQKSDFSATPGWHCKYCDFRDICEYRKY
ncbi:MAG: UvrD-helicase domain-containing protein [Candidatus Uhrbacteria bacterium]|nr:UvrD-helicase domain-containing protein [Candidatus Uhrbacteria bacterium]